ncbi:MULTISPECIES: hypothetical protein [unclassified Chelatococcus]|uniref:hypothetical protein n=1 Tax=unclassified Chelatococcus TaxID=2638111 RepID=UPI001BD0A696|nr:MULTISPECIES: hypothetical protein [unclassified Chelatococcus]MBS7696302.1 hypothetical protein [Chelatococcus sp. YT9]MBX3556911.1 hypothetical protein [Chelatococcus sp.]
MTDTRHAAYRDSPEVWHGLRGWTRVDKGRNRFNRMGLLILGGKYSTVKYVYSDETASPEQYRSSTFALLRNIQQLSEFT